LLQSPVRLRVAVLLDFSFPRNGVDALPTLGWGCMGARPADPKTRFGMMMSVGFDMQIGYVGLGNMGGALAGRLQKTHSLIIYDQNPAAAAQLVEAGARAAASLPELAAQCDIILLCLPTSRHVREVIYGSDGLAEGLKSGTLLIDQSTGDPAETRAMAATLNERSARLIDAPVSGGTAGAEAGTIAIMVGAAQEDYDRALPVLHAISQNVVHAGGVGNGHVIKLVNNMMSTVQRALSFEAVALAAKSGVDPGVATDILLMGGARNAYLEKMMAPRVLKGKLNVGFTLELALKDLRLACQLATAMDAPMLLGNIAREIYQLCRADLGGSSQVDTIGQFYDRMAGTQVVPADNDLN